MDFREASELGLNLESPPVKDNSNLDKGVNGIRIKMRPTPI